MDPIKEAFSKIKKDISLLKNEIFHLKIQIKNIQTNPKNNPLNTVQQTNTQTDKQKDIIYKHWVELPYDINLDISTGNEGVPTNTQTNTPTNQPTNQPTNNHTQSASNVNFKQIKNILSSLDNIKKEIRLKFKRLTPKEMLVFSTLYNLDEQKHPKITYYILAKQINLSESSIREYINKLINKGIPINKTKQNNKIIILNISQDLKNVTTLATIQKLREL